MAYWYSNPLLSGRVRNLNRLAKAAAAYNRSGGKWCKDYLYGCVTLKKSFYKSQLPVSNLQPYDYGAATIPLRHARMYKGWQV